MTNYTTGMNNRDLLKVFFWIIEGLIMLFTTAILLAATLLIYIEDASAQSFF